MADWQDIPNAAGVQYQTTVDDDGCTISCTVVPVRKDGAKGKGSTSQGIPVNDFTAVKREIQKEIDSKGELVIPVRIYACI